MKQGFLKIFIIFLVASISLFAAVVSAENQMDANADSIDTYTMEKSVERALDINPRMKATESELRKADADISMRRGDYFPTLSAQSYLERINSLYLKGTEDPDYMDQQVAGVTLRLSQPLFAGMTIYNTHQKSLLSKERVEAWQKQQENELILEIQLYFLELLKAREDVKSLRDSVSRLEMGVEAAEAFHERRLAPYTHVLQAHVDLADARQQLSQAENVVDTTRVRLNIILGFSAHRDIHYIGTLEKRGQWAKTFDECLDFAYANRPEIEVGQKGIELAEKDKKISLGRFLPRLNATVDYHIRDTDYDETSTNIFGQVIDRDRRNEYWTAGIRLQWELGLGGQQYHQYSRAAYEMQLLRHNLDETRNRVTAEVRTYFMNLREAEGRIDTMATAVKHAHEGYDMAQQRFNVRMGTISELLDAQARLSRAEAGYNQAIADYLSSKARLYHAMGREEHSL